MSNLPVSPSGPSTIEPNTLQEMVDDVDPDSVTEDDPISLDPNNDPSCDGLREISGLASWTVSTCKPSCGVQALLASSPSHFWQSDGPQPHLLTIHFVKRVTITKMRVYLDFLLDESYTPTRMQFLGGTGMHDLVQFAEWRGDEPRGWVDVELQGVGVEGKAELRAKIVQVKVLENHQNGKDTHVRGVQVFANDDRVEPSRTVISEETEGPGESKEYMGMQKADWMREPEIR
ncbi:anaphase promoting complex subunit doc1 [Mycoblastus sanguinarius]|nr:anaphase promoting complex subunit doc1 [Mycoblastus sanguinarius]